MKKRYSIIFLILICIFMMLEPMHVFAIDDIDSGRAKTLTIHFYTQKNGVDIPINGAEVGITKIADMYMKNGNVHFEVVDEYENLRDINLNSISTSDSLSVAEKFARQTYNYDYTGVIESNGEKTFDISDDGIYLVQEISVNGEASKYQIFSPYIILVPFISNENSNWNYDVVSEPKTAIKSITTITEHSTPFDESSVPEISTDETSIDEPSDEGSEVSVVDRVVTHDDIITVLTGDSTKVFGILGVVCISLLLVILLQYSKEDRGDIR